MQIVDTDNGPAVSYTEHWSDFFGFKAYEKEETVLLTPHQKSRYENITKMQEKHSNRCAARPTDCGVCICHREQLKDLIKEVIAGSAGPSDESRFTLDQWYELYGDYTTHCIKNESIPTKEGFRYWLHEQR